MRAIPQREGDGNEASGATARPFAAERVVRSGRLFLLEMSVDRIHSMKSRRIRPQDHRYRLPSPGRHHRGCGGWPHLLDQHVRANLDDGSIECADLDVGKSEGHRPTDVAHAAKQVHLDKHNGKL
jgi:hypothetical protein